MLFGLIETKRERQDRQLMELVAEREQTPTPPDYLNADKWYALCSDGVEYKGLLIYGFMGVWNDVAVTKQNTPEEAAQPKKTGLLKENSSYGCSFPYMSCMSDDCPECEPLRVRGDRDTVVFMKGAEQSYIEGVPGRKPSYTWENGHQAEYEPLIKEAYNHLIQ